MTIGGTAGINSGSLVGLAAGSSGSGVGGGNSLGCAALTCVTFDDAGAIANWLDEVAAWNSGKGPALLAAAKSG